MKLQELRSSTDHQDLRNSIELEYMPDCTCQIPRTFVLSYMHSACKNRLTPALAELAFVQCVCGDAFDGHFVRTNSVFLIRCPEFPAKSRVDELALTLF